MKIKNITLAAVGAAALMLGNAPQGGLSLIAAAQAQETVRPEVGRHLQAAAAMIKSGRYKEALGKIRDAEGVSGRTSGENNAIEGMRLSAAQGAKDPDSMARSYEALKAAGRMGGSQALQVELAIAGTYLTAGNASQASNWAQRYQRNGGNDPAAKQILASAQFKSGDMTGILRDTLEEVSNDERTGRTPSKDKLNLLLYAAQKKGDGATEAMAIEKLLNYYPSRELWAQQLDTLRSKKGFSDRFNLDLLRLRLATGNMRKAEDYSDYAQLAAAAGYPEEGKMVVESGMKAGVLGTGPQASRDKRLLDFLAKRIGENKAREAASLAEANDSRDGTALVQLGLAKVFRGQGADGVKLIEQGVAKDRTARPDDAKLYLGIGQYYAGNTSAAVNTWRTVRGKDGAGELARLWIIQVRSAKK